VITEYWQNYDRCLDRIRADGETVDDVIRILGEHYDPSAAEAFFPGGSDRSLLGTLMETPGWSTIWVNADYHFAARDSQGDALTYVEGDVYRGKR
jgi:hypothetical protein